MDGHSIVIDHADPVMTLPFEEMPDVMQQGCDDHLVVRAGLFGMPGRLEGVLKLVTCSPE